MVLASTLQYLVGGYRKRVKRSRLDLPGWKCAQGIWVKRPPGIFCENLLSATLTSQGNEFREVLDEQLLMFPAPPFCSGMRGSGVSG